MWHFWLQNKQVKASIVITQLHSFCAIIKWRISNGSCVLWMLITSSSTSVIVCLGINDFVLWTIDRACSTLKPCGRMRKVVFGSDQVLPCWHVRERLFVFANYRIFLTALHRQYLPRRTIAKSKNISMRTGWAYRLKAVPKPSACKLLKCSLCPSRYKIYLFGWSVTFHTRNMKRHK